MVQIGKSGDARFSRSDLGALALLIATAVFCAVIVLRSPRSVGFYIDDGVYLATGKALAGGQGYRHIELPGAPYQTKYPILYPLVLAIVWRCVPAFPDNIAVVQIINIVCWAVGSWFAYRYATRSWGLPWWLPACGVCLAFANLAVLSVLGTAMSEALYLALSMGALVLTLAPAAGQDGQSAVRVSVARAVCVGLLAGAVYLTRSIGVTLLIAILVAWLLRRQWRAAVTAGLVGALVIGGWQAWCARAAVANSAIAVAAEFRYDLNYRAWIPGSAGTLAWVAYQNTSEIMLDLFQNVVPVPADWVSRMVQSGLVHGFWFYLGLLATAGLMVLGCAITWARTRSAMHVYLCGYMALVLTWPFEPARFLFPILPILTTLLLAGLYTLIRKAVDGVFRVARARTRPAPAQPEAGLTSHGSGGLPGARIAWIPLVVLVLVLVYGNIRVLVERSAQQAAREDEDARAALMQIIRDRTPPRAVIAAESAAYVYLCTGRCAIPFLPFGDPATLFYPPDRAILACGRIPTSQQRAAYRSLLSARLLDYWCAAEATHFVDSPTGRGMFAHLRQSQPMKLNLVGTAWPYVLYQFSLPPR